MIKKGFLKSFFILGLTLLPISFINAESLTTTGGGIYVESNQNESFTLGNYTYDVDLIGNINSNDSLFLYKTATNNYINLQFAFGWINGKLYNISAWGNTNIVQGFVDKFCVRNSFPTSTDNLCTESITAEEFYNLNGPFDSISFGLAGSTNWNYAQTNFNPFSLCFKKGNNYYCATYSYNGPNNGYSGTLSFSNASFDSLSEYSWGVSPFSRSNTPTIPDYEFNEDDDFTNKQIIEGYNAMGLTDEFCYGGFALDNIFEAGSVPEIFTGYRWGSGAFIFDIWSIYSGAYNNDYISFLRSFYVSYVNNNYSDFYGKTKALYGFINQWASVSSKGLGFIESTAPTFTLVDVWQYCDLRFNKDPNSIYTGNRWDPKYRYYTSGQVNLGGYFNFSGNNNYFSGNLSGFNTPKDFFASLNSIFQGGLNNLDNREPVLPTYIIIFFLAIIFIRIISH